MNGKLYNIRRKFQYIAAKLLPKTFLAKVYFKIVLGYNLNLANPKTFNEKICWLKLFSYPYNSIVVNCSDKYKVREYINSKGLGEYLNDLYYVYNKVEDIQWDILPNKFVLKCNHGSAYNIICKNKNKMNISESKKLLKKWIKQDFGLFNIEPHYSNIQRRIICEKYLGNNILDYKFYCFNGQPKFYYISKDLDNLQNGKISFYDLEGHKIPVKRKVYKELEIKADQYDIEKMLKIVKILAEGFTFVRVDLFLVEKEIYFSELTFLPSGGMMEIDPQKYDYIWGEFLDIKLENKRY